ncbi:MAG: putative zinc-binding protein [Candidatus Hermodarchaeota archaeon]
MSEADINEKNIVIIPCSGSEYHGELARQVAIHLAEKSKIASISSMTCSTIFLKNVLLEKEQLVEITKNHLKHSFIIIINGCNTACASSIYEHLEIAPDLLISVQSIIPKPKMNLNDLRTFKNIPKLSEIKEEDIGKVIEFVLKELEKLGLDIDKFAEN